MKFSKMHGLGNDFMIVDAITQYVNFSSKKIRYLSDRHCGVGFDQLLIVESPRNSKSDFYYRIFNADGSETFQCGNGARCLASFVYMKKLTNKKDIYVSTRTRYMTLFIKNDNQVRVNMGKPSFNPKNIPFNTTKIKKTYFINIAKQNIFYNVVSIGNPHCVIIVKNLKTTKVATIGPILEHHKFFPEKVNVNFMQIISRKHIYLRVYERGVGETKSCGSGACAAVVVGIQKKILDKLVQVDLPGGKLIISWHGIGHPIYMTGSTNHIYDGFIYI